MKSLAGKLATALLLVVYVAAFMGFRLHECSVDHTVEVLSVLAGDHCEDVHHHHCSDQAHCGHHHHHCVEDHLAMEDTDGTLQISEADCCANSLFAISDAQIAQDDNDDIQCPVAMVSVFLCSPQPLAAFDSDITLSLSPFHEGRAKLALYSVIRV